MVCPYCHKKINTKDGKCPKCFAELPKIKKTEIKTEIETEIKTENKEEN